MKSDIHPKWHSDAKVVCACGNTTMVGMAKAELHVEICAKCHPFFTGEMRFLDTMGRVEKFQSKQQFAKSQATKIADKKKKKKDKEEARANAPKSLKDMLMTMR